MNFKEIEEYISQETHEAFQKAVQEVNSLEAAATDQVKDTKVAAGILLDLGKGDKVSNEQILFLKDQSVNLGKVFALISVQAIPGSSAAIIILEKIALKHGFTLFPQALKIPGTPVENR
jgi:hypothetical protein